MDTCDESIQDMLSGSKGSFRVIQRALKELREAGYPSEEAVLGVETLICRHNIDEIAAVWRWLRDRGVTPYLSVASPCPSAGGDESLHVGLAQVQEVFAQIAGISDVLVGNEEDLQKGLGIEGQDVEKKSKLDPSAFYAVIEKATKKYPNVKIVGTTLREVHSTNRHSWGAVAWVNGKTFQSPTCELDVLDRVGGGDGYASGFFYGLMTGESPEESVKLGWAHGALLTTFPGDTTMSTVEQVRAFAKGGSARIQR